MQILGYRKVVYLLDYLHYHIHVAVLYIRYITLQLCQEDQENSGDDLGECKHVYTWIFTNSCTCYRYQTNVHVPSSAGNYILDTI